MDDSLIQIWPIVLAFLLSVIWVVREMAKLQTRIEVQRTQIKILFQKIDKIGSTLVSKLNTTPLL